MNIFQKIIQAVSAFLVTAVTIMNPSAKITPAPKPVSALGITASMKDEAGRILSGSPWFSCPPDKEIMDKWLKEVLGENGKFENSTSGKLKNHNQYFWACCVLYKEKYSF